MSLGLIFDSDEWSNHHLAHLLRGSGIETDLINLEEERVLLPRLQRHSLIVNRLFPSALFRGHPTAFSLARNTLLLARDLGVPLLNPYEAFAYDWSKACTSVALAAQQVPVPRTFAYLHGTAGLGGLDLPLPCVIKPDCGGRSLHTRLLTCAGDLAEAGEDLPPVPLIAQELIEPGKGFTTRVEIVGGRVVSKMKRLVGEGAISSYHAGSEYQIYPDCPQPLLDAACRALQVLHIEMGSLDVIETTDGEFRIIDVNATSNFSEDNIEMFGYDPIQPMAEHIVTRYRRL